MHSKYDLQSGFDPSKKSGVGVDFELLVRSLQVKKNAAGKSSMICRWTECYKKRLAIFCILNIFFLIQNICAPRRDTRPLGKSKTGPGKAAMIFSDIIFADRPRKDFNGCQLHKLFSS